MLAGGVQRAPQEALPAQERHDLAAEAVGVRRRCGRRPRSGTGSRCTAPAWGARPGAPPPRPRRPGPRPAGRRSPARPRVDEHDVAAAVVLRARRRDGDERDVALRDVGRLLGEARAGPSPSRSPRTAGRRRAAHPAPTGWSACPPRAASRPSRRGTPAGGGCATGRPAAGRGVGGRTRAPSAPEIVWTPAGKLRAGERVARGRREAHRARRRWPRSASRSRRG